MKRMMMMLLALVALNLSFVGCGDDDDDGPVGVADPAIKVTITATPSTTDTGMKVAVSAAAVVSDPSKLDGLVYQWLSAAGSFSDASAESTSWTAPDSAGLFTVTVTVTNGDDVGIDTKDIIVGAYVALTDPFYRGASAYCVNCHNGGVGDQYTTWVNTPHAGAIDALAAIGMDENENCLGCHTVGTYGLVDGIPGTDDLDNGGYDETAVARLAGVQCENCHGPGSEHANNGNFGNIHISMDAQLCGQCHTDEHHPTFDEWETSGHGSGAATEDGFQTFRTGCAKCHNGVEAVTYLDDPLNYEEPASVTETAKIVCATCHDPHSDENHHQLRNASVTDVILPNSVIVEDAGAGRLCMSCHNGRRQDFDVIEHIFEGSSHFGPHHSVQGDMLKGVNAYEEIDESFTFASSKHLLVKDGCVHCHTHGHDGDLANGIPNFTGHTFEPTVEACFECHGTISDFADIGAKEDYDGDGSVEGVQGEVEGLLETLEAIIIADCATGDCTDSLTVDFEHFIGDTLLTSVDQRKAAYNWTFVKFDGSTGVHNRTYAVQLLQQSIEFLDDSALKHATILLGD